MQIDGTRIVVTGASRGIGRSLTQQLVAAGARVVAVARDAGALTQLAQENGGAITPMPCDLANRDQRAGLIARLRDLDPPVDMVINNAAIQIETSYLDTPPDQAARDLALELAINLEAPAHLCAGLLGPLAQRPQAAIVNVTSALAFAPKRMSPVYCATKAGVQRFTQALRYQTRQSCPHVRVSEVVLPLVDTDMTAGRGSGKISPDAAAAAILRGIEGGSDRIWVGKARMFGVMYRLSPVLAAWILRG